MSRNYSLGICTLFILVASSLGFAASVFADERLPIPDEAAQKQAAALVQEIFGEEIENARTSNQKLALTEKLIEESSSPNTTPPGRYALLKVALENAPDATTAMDIVDEMTSHFEIDGLKIKALTVLRMANQARTSSQHKSVVQAALQLIDESVERDAYDPAITLAEIATWAAQKARIRSLMVELRSKTSEVRKQKTDFEKAQAAVTVLEQEPTNAAANLTVGLYHCLVKGDWETGVPMLALGSDENLKNLAVQDLKLPTNSNEQVALADDWYDQAEEADKQRMLQRAGFWYRMSLESEPELSRLVRIKVDKRLKEVGELLPAASFSCERHAIKKVAVGGLMFNDRDYKFGNTTPEKFLGMNYIQSSCSKGMSEAVCIKSGMVYAVTPNDRNNQSKALRRIGFENFGYVDGFGPILILRKWALRGEKISIKRWGFLIFEN